MVSSLRILVRQGRIFDPTSRRDAAVGDLLIDGEKIAEIAPTISISDVDEIIDASGAIVSPGFVDGHRHVWQTNIRGIAADWSLFEYLHEIRMRIAGAYRPEDVYLGNLLGSLEMIDAGVTTVCDHSHIVSSPEHAEAAIRGLHDSGIRAVYAHGFYDVPGGHSAFPSHRDRLIYAKKLRKQRFGAQDARVTMGVALSELGIVDWAETRAEIEVGREIGRHISVHNSGVGYQGGTAWFVSEGLLGPDILHVHANRFTDDDLVAVRDAGGAICITPETELQMGMGFPITHRCRALNVNMAFGADIVSACSGDLLTQTRLSLQVARAFENQPAIDRGSTVDKIDMNCDDAFRIATRGGAQSIGLGSTTGTLEVGKSADIIIVKQHGWHLTPSCQSASSLLLQARPGDISTVIVAGVVRKRDGKIQKFDLGALNQQMEASRDHILASASSYGDGQSHITLRNLLQDRIGRHSE
ncbi:MULTISPECIES: amidohydrolase family protein [Bradyrhizobium]|uniref:amidohydrolase family protein n=1 Tax=Bradyrhizobium TaxID=374 RepID=UPI0004ADB946|nr:amidohydrolase family protein [Bradyrhizobium elkanii]MDH6690388.1 5-methylthioadenosine/S-adenosylhomocysteine deaminase [Bradyrhizobium elkanii]WLA43048.1 amidohydrolase family protein [Bradyrhizobium elkanii]